MGDPDIVTFGDIIIAPFGDLDVAPYGDDNVLFGDVGVAPFGDDCRFTNNQKMNLIVGDGTDGNQL